MEPPIPAPPGTRIDAVNDAFLTRFGDEVGRRNEVTVPSDVVTPRPGNPSPAGLSKQIAVHVGGTATHCGAREDVLGNEVLEKTLRRMDFDLARLHVVNSRVDGDAGLGSPAVSLGDSRR